MSKRPKRPAFSDRSFLAAVFSPTKNPVPTGIRKRPVKGTVGRKASRVRSYNAMPPINQLVLYRSDMRDQYLRGDATLADAKRALRGAAVDLGIAKPLRSQKQTIRSGSFSDPATRAYSHLVDTLSSAPTRNRVNVATVRQGTLLMTDDQLRHTLDMDFPAIVSAAKNPDLQVEINGKMRNPYWYK